METEEQRPRDLMSLMLLKMIKGKESGRCSKRKHGRFELEMEEGDEIDALLHRTKGVLYYGIYGVCIGILACRGLSLVSSPLHAMKSQSQIQSSAAVNLGVRPIIEYDDTGSWANVDDFLVHELHRLYTRQETRDMGLCRFTARCFTFSNDSQSILLRWSSLVFSAENSHTGVISFLALHKTGKTVSLAFSLNDWTCCYLLIYAHILNTMMSYLIHDDERLLCEKLEHEEYWMLLACVGSDFYGVLAQKPDAFKIVESNLSKESSIQLFNSEYEICSRRGYRWLHVTKKHLASDSQTEENICN
ncbi:hypothetical protein Tco_0397752 [Tanacetum coccineum]